MPSIFLVILFLLSAVDRGFQDNSVETNNINDVDKNINNNDDKNEDKLFKYCDKASSFYEASSNGTVLANVLPSAESITFEFHDEAKDVASCVCACERNATCNAALWADETCVFVSCRLGLTPASTLPPDSCDLVKEATQEVNQTFYVVIKSKDTSSNISPLSTPSSFPLLASLTPTSTDPALNTTSNDESALSLINSFSFALNTTPSLDDPSTILSTVNSSANLSFTTAETFTSGGKYCEEACTSNSTCVSGRCICDSGFHNQSGACIIISDSTNESKSNTTNTNNNNNNNNHNTSNNISQPRDLNTTVISQLPSNKASSSKATKGLFKTFFTSSSPFSKRSRISDDKRTIAQLNSNDKSKHSNVSSATSEKGDVVDEKGSKLSIFTQNPNLTVSGPVGGISTTPLPLVSDPVGAISATPLPLVSDPVGAISTTSLPIGSDPVGATSTTPLATASPTPPFSSTSPPGVPAPPPPPHLVVSAGDARELQLPDNSVSITAYALPKPEEGEKNKYEYSWTLISHPKPTDGKSMGKV